MLQVEVFWDIISSFLMLLCISCLVLCSILLIGCEISLLCIEGMMQKLYVWLQFLEIFRYVQWCGVSLMLQLGIRFMNGLCLGGSVVCIVFIMFVQFCGLDIVSMFGQVFWICLGCLFRQLVMIILLLVFIVLLIVFSDLVMVELMKLQVLIIIILVELQDGIMLQFLDCSWVRMCLELIRVFGQLRLMKLILGFSWDMDQDFGGLGWNDLGLEMVVSILVLYVQF